MNTKPFLTAEWQDLIMANYIIDPAILSSFIPPKTELDFYKGNCYISLVGFMFNNVRVKGLRIPFHTDFPEVNLRFYVRYKENENWQRGVVFIKEIVPKPMISFVANSLFAEKYSTMPMKNNRASEEGKLTVSYAWKNAEWNLIHARAFDEKIALQKGSEEEFITEHFWGYSFSKGKTSEYHVSHPEWKIYPMISHELNCDYGKLYGSHFNFLEKEKPVSFFLAEGSAISVYNKRFI